MSEIYGNVKASEAENKEHDGLVSAKRMVEVPSNQQARWVYDSSGNCIYAAYTASGRAESDAGWLIQKFTWSGGNCTSRLIAYDSFSNYLTASYA